MLNTAAIYIQQETQTQLANLRRELEYIVIRISDKAREARALGALACKFRTSLPAARIAVAELVSLHGRPSKRHNYTSRVNSIARPYTRNVRTTFGWTRARVKWVNN